MKKYVLAPLCSAVLVPGMGQVINQHRKKGLILMGIVFLLLIAATLEFFKMIQPILDPLEWSQSGLSGAMRQMQAGDSSRLGIILILFLILWLYSIIDALIYGLKLEKKNK
jgi:TM2 domain-containing membrane protein YozV